MFINFKLINNNISLNSNIKIEKYILFNINFYQKKFTLKN